MTTTVNFIVARAENICDWTGRSDGAEAFFGSIADKVMAGDFAVSGPSSSAGSAPSGQSAAKPQATASGHAVEFRAAVGDAIKTLQGAAAALAIP